MAQQGIGAFVVGQSAIGTPPFDYTPTILSQYANSPTIMALIASFSGFLDPAGDIDTFFDYVWSIDTAQGFGLDIWGRILGIGRVYQVVDPLHFGFDEAIADGTVGAFGEGVFWSGTPLTGNFALSDAAYRRVLLAKAYSNFTSSSIPDLNRLLRILFPGRGNCYVQDNLNMSLTYVLNFTPTPVENTIINSSGVLPRPGGVAMSVTHL